MKNSEALLSVLSVLKDKLDKEEFVFDRETKMVEVLNASLVLDPTQKEITLNGRSTPMKYVEQELKWYDY